jgi:hypothetical protein
MSLNPRLSKINIYDANSIQTDVHAIIHDVFRHRLVISEHALTNHRTHDEIIDIILAQVPYPKGLAKES